MPTFQSKSRSTGNFEVFIKNRSIRNDFKSKSTQVNGAIKWSESSNSENQIISLIKQADTVKLAQIFKHYGIDLDEYSRKTQCPFKFHSDNTPSFHYYPETNSFYCWGCKNGGGPVIFLSLLEDLSKETVASKLINNFESEEIDHSLFIKSKEKEDLHLRFSSVVRNFLKTHNTIEDLQFIDRITQGFDKLTQNHSIDVDGIRHIIDTLEEKIGDYECQ